MQSSERNSADHLLYRVYFKLCVEDVLFHLGQQEGIEFPPNKENKELLHNFHKGILGYETISDESHEVVSRFIQEVCQFWAMERGIFVRTSKKQPLWIECLALSDIVEVWNEEKQVKEEKRVWDLL